MIRFVACLLSFSFSLLVMAESPKRFALVMGGAEQPGLPFDYSETFNVAFTKLKEAGYTSVHSVIEDKPRVEFTAAAAREKLEKLTDQISQAPPGSQALIVIQSHGAPRAFGGIHKILTSSGEPFDVGEFEALQKVAKEKGVRLAILDLSCYSGQSLALANRDPTTCVITGGSADMVADAHFGKEMFGRMEKGKNLETSFLEARPRVEHGYPQISSPEGAGTSDLLNVVHSNASLFKADILTSFKKKNCKETHLLSQLSDLSKFLRKSFDIEESQVESLDLATRNYISNRQAFQDDEAFLNSRVTILDRGVMMRDLLYSHLSGSKQLLEAAEKKRKEISVTERQRLDQIYNRQAFEAGFGYTIGKDRRFWDLASDVATAERPIYTSVYEKMKSSESNACRDFQF